MIVPFAEFQKLELKIGKIKNVEEVEGLDRIYKLTVDLGKLKPRLILSGLKEYFQPDELLGKNVIVVVNLEPKKMRGVVSEGMLLAADVEGRPILLIPEEEVKPGTKVH